MIRKIKRATWATACLIATMAYSAPAAAAPQSNALAAVVPADIPVGPADDNPETSRGLTAIMDNCIAAYAGADHMHAEGVYVVASKSEDEETSYLQAKVTLDYHRPNQMAIISTSESTPYNCRFIADGTTVTMVDGKEYYQIPKPSSLAAFSDDHRAGELYEEHSGAMGISAVAAMLMSDSPSKILLEGISRYIYEGEENTAGVDCHRLRFIQEGPDVIVILWIEKNTWLIRKTSFIYSYDADYNIVDSFDEGVNANMSIMTWEELSTDSAAVNNAAFSKSIPAGTKKAEETGQTVSRSVNQTSMWESLVAAAAETSPEQTTWSLSREFGAVDLQLKRFTELPESILDFAPVLMSGSTAPFLGVATHSGNITVHKADGSIMTTVTLNRQISNFAFMDSSSSGPLFLTANEGSTALSAYNIQGNLAWTYQYPYKPIRYLIATTGTERAVYLTLAGQAGVRKLDENGQVLFANGKPTYTGSLRPAPQGVERLLYGGAYKIAVMDKRLNLINSIDTDELVRSALWDETNAAAPILDLAVTEDSDVLLQRRASNGEIIWTTMIAPKAEEVLGSGLVWVKLKVEGKIQRCIFIMLSDGQTVVTTVDGKVLYRGQVSANDALVKRNNGDVLQNIAVADLNHDNIDEIYTKIDTHLMQLTTP